MNTNLRIKQLKAEISRLQKADQLRSKLDKVCKKAGFGSLAEYLSVTGSATAPSAKKKTRKRLTPQQKAEILEKIKGGAKKTALAEEYGVHYQTIVKMKA